MAGRIWMMKLGIVCVALALGSFACDDEVTYFDNRLECSSEPEEDATGSTENPYRIESVEFREDGTAYRLFDDMMLNGDYEIVDDQVTVYIEEFDKEFVYELSEDGMSLVDEYGTTLECEVLE